MLDQKATQPVGENSIRISEIFGPTIQGEGALIGEPTVFVRTGGCDYRCSWCDTLHAVDSDQRHSWQPMSSRDILDRIRQLSGDKPLMVSLSGGNPAIQPLGPLIRRGKAAGYHFAIETQGSVAADWFADLDLLTLSPKGPSSGMETDWEIFDDCLDQAGEEPDIALKIVIFDEEDYLWARKVAAKYPQLPLYLQPGNHTPPPPDQEDAHIDIDGILERMRWLVDRAAEDQWFEARILPQLHVLLWGNLRGV